MTKVGVQGEGNEVDAILGRLCSASVAMLERSSGRDLGLNGLHQINGTGQHILALLKFFGQSAVLLDTKVLIRNAKGNKMSPKPTKVNEHVCEKNFYRGHAPLNRLTKWKPANSICKIIIKWNPTLIRFDRQH